MKKITALFLLMCICALTLSACAPQKPGTTVKTTTTQTTVVTETTPDKDDVAQIDPPSMQLETGPEDTEVEETEEAEEPELEPVKSEPVIEEPEEVDIGITQAELDALERELNAMEFEDLGGLSE